MVGVNCAACHVGAVTSRAATLPLLGAPNLFDLNAFYQELFASLGVMLKDEATRLQFLTDLAKQGDAEFAILTQQLLAAAAVASQLDGASLKEAAQLFQVRLIEVVKEAVAKAEAEARQAGHPPDAAAIAALKKAVMAKVGQLYEKDALGLVALVLSGDAPDDPVDAAIKASPDPLLAGVLQQLKVGLSLLRARVRFVASLKALHARPAAAAGPGTDRRLRRHPRPGLPPVRRHRRRLAGQLSRALAGEPDLLAALGRQYQLAHRAQHRPGPGARGALRGGRPGRLPFAGAAREHRPARAHRAQAGPARVARPALRPDRSGQGRAGQGHLPGPLRGLPQARPAGRPRHPRRHPRRAGLGRPAARPARARRHPSPRCSRRSSPWRRSAPTPRAP